MVFNDTGTEKSGAIQEFETWFFGSEYGAISGNANLLATFTRMFNHGLDETTIEMFKSDGKWQVDDNTFSTIPVATTTLTPGLQKYTLKKNHLKITGVEVLNNIGDYVPVTQLDYRQIRQHGQSDTEFFKEDGLPLYYDVVGDQLKLYPAPAASDVTLAAGLRLIYQRGSNYFLTTDTTKDIGVPSLFEELPVLFGSAKYAKSNNLTDKAREIDAEISRVTGNIKSFLNARNVDKKKSLRPAYRPSI